jgi:hypothetical protein
MAINRLLKVFAVLSLAMTSALLLSPPGYAAEGYALLKGFWQCQEEGEQTTLEFQSKNQLIYNGQPANYQLRPNAFRVIEDSGPADYFYQYLEGTLIIFSPDGSMTYCQKAKKRAHQAQQSTRPHSTTQNWPKYERPQKSMTGDESDLQSLLYKFAGRWDHVTSNTLTNLYLKPDGTYEESYEAGYGGQFQDQGGYQTGHWGTTGTDQGQGRWTIQGTLKRGTLTLIAPNGNRTVYQYRVHYKNGEYYWSEYFFNGKLYSVKYIYR